MRLDQGKLSSPADGKTNRIFLPQIRKRERTMITWVLIATTFLIFDYCACKSPALETASYAHKKVRVVLELPEESIFFPTIEKVAAALYLPRVGKLVGGAKA